MKKRVVMGVVTMLALSLAGCAGLGADEALTDSTQDVNTLLFGTLRLEGTELAVSPAMASELLPLWQAARTVFTSDASAPEEMQAILQQIREVMTAEQIAAIEDMDLALPGTGPAMGEMMGTALPEGLEVFGEAVTGSEGFVFSERRGPGGGPDGLPGFQGGGVIVGGAGIVGGEGFVGEMSPEARATLEAERGGRPRMGVNPGLFDILIELLQVRAGEE